MRASRFRLEWIVVAAIVGILAGIALPQLFHARERARRATCENIYVALDAGLAGELQQPVDNPLRGMTAPEIVRLAVNKHQDEDNPRNRAQRAYTSAPITPADACQVRIEAAGADQLLFAQYPVDDEPLRTFSVAIPR